MATSSPEDLAGGSESIPVRDVSRLTVEHPIPLYDPVWLRNLHYRCLWDGGPRTTGSVFCCARCEERYLDWEQRTAHVVLGREPLQTFLEQGREP
jgi:hypothetical protein